MTDITKEIEESVSKFTNGLLFDYEPMREQTKKSIISYLTEILNKEGVDLFEVNCEFDQNDDSKLIFDIVTQDPMLARFLKRMSEDSELLESEFEQVLFDNLWDMYQE